MMSTPSASIWRAKRSFSSGERLLPGACSPSRSVVSKIRTSGIPIRRFQASKGTKEKRRGLCGPRRQWNQWRLIVSCRHAVDLLLTNKDGKQDAEEDDDEKDQLHELFVCWGRPAELYARAGSG